MLTATLRLAPRPASVPEARRFVMRCLERWSLDELCETAALLTSEVVSNAVLHARTEVVLTVADLGGGTLEVRVTDSSSVAPVQRRHSADATTGRGIQLLEQLALEWEVLREAQGKTLRFTVGGDRDPWAAFRDDAWLEAER